MEIEEIIQKVAASHSGLVRNTNWGEVALFYNPDNKLKRVSIFSLLKKMMVKMTSHQISPSAKHLELTWAYQRGLSRSYLGKYHLDQTLEGL